jgi:RHH-type rel operon transcriptional repressor/antitoxin RelB
MSTTVSFRVSKQISKELSDLAKATDRTKAWHAEQAMKNYLELLDWQIKHIRKGLKEIEEGKGIPHDEVVARMRRRIAKDRKKRA